MTGLIMGGEIYFIFTSPSTPHPTPPSIPTALCSVILVSPPPKLDFLPDRSYLSLGSSRIRGNKPPYSSLAPFLIFVSILRFLS